MAISTNEVTVSVRALHAVSSQLHFSHLIISLNRTFIRGIHMDSQRNGISMFFPTHLLEQPSLLRLHIQNELSVSGHHLSLHVCGKLARSMSENATSIRLPVDHPDQRFNGFFFTADIKIFTSDNAAMLYHFLGYQATDQTTNNPTVATSSNMAEINYNNNDDQVNTIDVVTTAEVTVRALPAVSLQPHFSHLKISLNPTFIVGLNMDSQRNNITMFFPTHLLEQPSLLRLHIQNNLSVSGHHISLRVCGRLARSMSETATLIKPPVDHPDQRSNGFSFMADIKIFTSDNAAMPYHFLGYQATDQRTNNPTVLVATSSNMAEINSNNNDDQVIIFDAATTAEGSSSQTSPSPTTSITQRLQQIEKLKKIEHEVLNAGNENIRDQLGDRGGCCSICLEDFLCDGINEKKKKKKKNMKLVRLGCTHLYHLTCILQWLDQKDSCPLCRRHLFKPS